jgi:hypothetical protein
MNVRLSLTDDPSNGPMGWTFSTAPAERIPPPAARSPSVFEKEYLP